MSEKKKKNSLFLKINQLLWKRSFLQRFRALYTVIDACLLATVKKPKPQSDPSARKKVLIVYNLAFGDGVMFYGACASLRTIYPTESYEITIACQSAFADLYRQSGIFDLVLPLDFSGATVHFGKRRALYRQLRSVWYDLVIDPIGCEACTTNVFATRACVGKEKIGVLDLSLPKIHTSARFRRRSYDRVIPLPKEQKARQLLSFYSAFFSELAQRPFPPTLARFSEVPLSFDLPQRFFIVFPTASMPVKGWNLSRFATLCVRIFEQTNLPLVVCGTKQDGAVLSDFVSLLPKELPVFDFVGQTSLMQFITLIGKAELIVTNDTSAYHIGVAKEIPTYLLCGGYTYDRYANYDWQTIGCRAPTLIHCPMECYNCNNFCKYSGFDVFPCIENITLEHAWEVVLAGLEKDGMQKNGF